MTAVVAFKLESPLSAVDHMLGQSFVEGEVPAGQYLTVDAPGAVVAPLSYWPDGSVRHARVAGEFVVTPNVEKQFNVLKSSIAPEPGTLMTASSIAAALGGRTDTHVTFGTLGSIALHSLLSSPARTFLSTRAFVECHYHARLAGDSRLYAIFYVTLYASGKAFVAIDLGNGDVSNTTNTSKPRKDYVPTVVIGGTTVYNNSAETFYHFSLAAPTLEGWIGTDPQVTWTPDYGHLMRTGMIPNYSWKLGQTSQATIDGWSGATRPVNVSGSGAFTASLSYVPGENCCLTPLMGAAGFQDGIGPIPNWESLLVVTQGNQALFEVMKANAKAFGSYGVAWVDPVNLDPIKISAYPAYTSQGLGQSGGSPIVTQKQNLTTNLTWESAHVPLFVLPWLLTSDYRYMRSMAFNALSVYMTTTSANGSGVNRRLTGQVRGQAWNRKLIAAVAALYPASLESLYGDFKTWIKNDVTAQSVRYTDAALGTGAKFLGMVDEYSNYKDGISYESGAPTPAGTYLAVVALWGHHFNASSMDYLCKLKPVATADFTPFISFRNFVLQSAVWCAGGTGADEFNFGRLGTYLKAIRTDIRYNGDYSGPAATHFIPADPGMIFRDTLEVSANATTNAFIGTSGSSPTSATGYIANWWPAIAGAVDAGIPGAAAAFTRVMAADNITSQTVTAGYQNVPVWGVMPLSFSQPVNSFTAVDAGDVVTTPGPKLAMGVGSVRGAGTRVMDTRRGFGLPLSEIPSGGTDGTTPWYDMIQPGDDPNSEMRIAITGDALTPNGEGGAMYDGAPGAVGYEVWVDGASLGSATMTFADADSSITGITISPTTATGSTTFIGTVSGDGEFSTAHTFSKTGGGSIHPTTGAFTAPAQTSSIQVIVVRVTSDQDEDFYAEATITIAAAIPSGEGPIMVGAITAVATSSTIEWAWPAATDDDDIGEYVVSLDGASPVSTGLTRALNSTGLAAETLYSLEVTAYDTEGNPTDAPLTLSFSTLAASVTPTPDPTLPDPTPPASAASRSYTWLKAAVHRWTHRPNDAALIDAMDDLIMLAEKRISRDLEARLQNASVVIATTASLSAALLPHDVAEIHALHVPGYAPMSYLTPDQFNSHYATECGPPCHYTVIGSYLHLGPMPDAVYSLHCAYRQRIPSLLDELDGVNWLIRDCPDIYLTAVMCEALNFIEQLGKLPVWEMKYEKAVDSQNKVDWHTGGSLRVRSDVKH